MLLFWNYQCLALTFNENLACGCHKRAQLLAAQPLTKSYILVCLKELSPGQ